VEDGNAWDVLLFLRSELAVARRITDVLPTGAMARRIATGRKSATERKKSATGRSRTNVRARRRDVES